MPRQDFFQGFFSDDRNPRSAAAGIRAARRAGIRGSNDLLRARANIALGRGVTARQRGAYGRSLTRSIELPGELRTRGQKFSVRYEYGSTTYSIVRAAFGLSIEYDYLFLDHNRDRYESEEPAIVNRQSFTARVTRDVGTDLARLIQQAAQTSGPKALSQSLQEQFGVSQASFHMDYRVREILVTDLVVEVVVRSPLFGGI